MLNPLSDNRVNDGIRSPDRQPASAMTTVSLAACLA